MADFITTHGLDDQRKAIERMTTEYPATKREIQSIVRKAIKEARRNIVKDAQSALENDPRQAFRAVRYSVYQQILGGQVNIISPYRRGAATKYQKQRKLDENPHQRGGNRRKRSSDTIRMDSYHGKDRTFVLRFQESGTVDRETRYGRRGAIRARHWFRTSSAYQLNTAASRVVEEIEKLLASEFKTL